MAAQQSKRRAAKEAAGQEASDLTNKERIVASALELFGEQGFAATTIRQIGADAGVAPSLLYRHFKDKEELRQAVDAEVLEELTAIFTSLKLDTDLSTAVSHYFQATRHLFRYVARSLMEPNERTVGFQHLYFDGIVEMYQVGRKEGRIRKDLDIQQLALLGLVDSFGVVLFEPLVKETFKGAPGEKKLEQMRRKFFDDIWQNGIAPRD